MVVVGHLNAGGDWHLVIEDSFNDEAWYGETQPAYLEAWSLAVEPRDAGKADQVAAEPEVSKAGGCAMAPANSGDLFSLLMLLGLVLARRRQQA